MGRTRLNWYCLFALFGCIRLDSGTVYQSSWQKAPSCTDIEAEIAHIYTQVGLLLAHDQVHTLNPVAVKSFACIMLFFIGDFP